MRQNIRIYYFLFFSVSHSPTFLFGFMQTTKLPVLQRITLNVAMAHISHRIVCREAGRPDLLLNLSPTRYDRGLVADGCVVLSPSRPTRLDDRCVTYAIAERERRRRSLISIRLELPGAAETDRKTHHRLRLGLSVDDLT